MGARVIGRHSELQRLAALLDDAAAGRGRSVVVLGEPGIGKTTLCEALARSAAERAVVVAWGRCTEEEAPPYWPWRQLLRRMGDPTILERPPAGGARAELFGRVGEHLASLPGPALVVVEDIHWADAASLALLRFVVDFLPDLPLLLVVTARDDPADAVPEATALLRCLPAGVERLALAGLDPDGVAEVVADVLGVMPAVDLVAKITERTGGNPFFVREVAWLQAGRGAGGRMIVPPGVQQVLERRLARLSQDCMELLNLAAVIGEPDPDVVAAMLERPLSVVLDLLGEAVDARLVVHAGRGLRFAHALVREVIEAQQPVAQRRALHRRAAEVLEQRGGEGSAVVLGRVAAHWRQASGDDVAARAAVQALAAARDARERLGFEQAVRFYGWALEAPPEDELALRVELGETQMLAGDLAAGRGALRAAADAARRDGRPSLLARAVLAMGTGVGGFEVDLDDERQIPLLEDAASRLEAEPGSAEAALRAPVLARLSLVTAGRWQEQDRARLAQEAIELARAGGDARAEVAALAAWCDARSGPDHLAERLEKAREMVAAAGRLEDPASLLLARRFLIVALAERGDFAAFDDEVGAYARTADRLALPLYSWVVPLWRGMRALMEGSFAAVRRNMASAQALGGRAGSANAEAMVLTLRLWAARWADEPDELATVVRLLTSLFRDSSYYDVFFPAFLTLAGDVEEARRCVRRGTATALPAVPRDAEYLTCLWSLGDAIMLLDERDAAEPVYQALEPYADLWVVDGIGAACLGVVAHQLGRLAAYLGRAAEARGWLEQALSAHRGAGARLLATHTEVALGTLAAADARAAARTAAPAADEGTLRRSGKVWQLRWGGVEATVPDSKGMRDLATLLAAPDRQVHVLDLVEAAGGPPARAAGGNTGERLDATARAAYRRRLVELDGDLAEAEAHADAARIAALREEQQFLAAELAAALGMGGRVRTTGDPAERARTAVANRLRTALSAVTQAHPSLGRHLKRSITTGRFCVYAPEQPVSWRVTAAGASRTPTAR